jgi:riboflavin kinase/FMN adenylyltransferase
MTQTLPTTPPFRIARDLAAAAAGFRGAVVAIGNFDGVHRGHRAVLAAAMERARRLGRPALALTFEPHTRAYFRPYEPFFRLTDPCSKLRLLATTGLDGAVVLPFDAPLAGLTAEDFVRRVLVEQLAIKGATVGFDFHFGQARKGSPDFLAAQGAQLGFPVDVVAPLADDGRPISSSAIRAALSAGDVTEAATLLGYPWFVTATVVHGEKRGRDLGFPTANLRLDPACGLKHGIYAVRVGLGDRRIEGVASFGRRPTFDNGAPLLEVFLFDFKDDLYGQLLDVALIGFIRPELRFDNVDDLIGRMNQDAGEARTLLAAAPYDFPTLAALAEAEAAG